MEPNPVKWIEKAKTDGRFAREKIIRAFYHPNTKFSSVSINALEKE